MNWINILIFAISYWQFTIAQDNYVDDKPDGLNYQVEIPVQVIENYENGGNEGKNLENVGKVENSMDQNFDDQVQSDQSDQMIFPNDDENVAR